MNLHRTTQSTSASLAGLFSPHRLAALACGLLVSATTLTTHAAQSQPGGIVSNVQSTARPYGLDIAGQVMKAGSDDASADFQHQTLPHLLNYVRSTLPEQRNNTASSAFQLDPTKIKLKNAADVRVYFASEGAAYHNTLGFNTTGSGVATGNPKLIFPDASTSENVNTPGIGGNRTQSEPLLSGDFVNLGNFGSGTLLDFFLIANGANGGRQVFTGNSTSNPDGQQHVAAFTPRLFSVPNMNSPYIFLSFEDLNGGGDRDFNDLVFAIDIGRGNVAALFATPEPSLYATLGGFVGLAYWGKRRMKKSAPANLSPA